MKKKNIMLKIIAIILLLLVFSFAFINNNSFAWDVEEKLKAIDNSSTSSGEAGNKVTKLMGATINLVSTIAAGIAIIMLTIIGIKYVSNSTEAKADAKKDLPGYVIGAVILFGVSGLLRLLQMFIDANLNK